MHACIHTHITLPTTPLIVSASMNPPSTTESLALNRLLQRLPAGERRRFEAHARHVSLPSGSVLCEAGKRMSHVYFPHDGYIALAAEAEPDEVVHLGLVGEEGMLGLFVAAGASAAPLRAVVQREGRAAQVDASGFTALLKRCPSLQQSLLAYSHRLMAQIAQAVVCNTLHPVASRLARWLLTASDRLHSHTIVATQDQVAEALGVLRLAVNQTATAFQDEGLISYRRGVIEIETRAGLEARACACYGIHNRIFNEVLDRE